MKPAQIPVEDVRRMYLRELLTMKEIAAHFDCAESSIRRLLIKHEIPLRSYSAIKLLARVGPKGTHTQYDAQEVCRLYVTDKLSTKEIARRLGCTQPAVYYILKRKGIRTRNLQDSLKLCWQVEQESKKQKKQYRLNEKFFSNWTPQMAWVLGLLYTDGHIEQTGHKVCLTSNDLVVLHNVRELLGYTGPIRKVNSTKAGRITICRKTLCDDLRRLGMFPAKSNSVTFPAMPDSMVRHFLRGCWDGDGCFSENRGTMVASFVSGSKDFAVQVWAQLVHFLPAFHESEQKCTLITVPEQVRLNGGKLSVERERYHLSFGGIRAVREFTDFLYKDVPATECMLRKRNLLTDHWATRDYRQENPWKPSRLTKSSAGSMAIG